jgi:ATP-dependent Clp protease ATP-binding subunit ClpB
MQRDVYERRQHWEKEKALIMGIGEIKEKIDHAKTEADELERKGDFGRVAEIRYGVVSNLEKELKEKNKQLVEIQKGRKMLKEEVDEEDIAKVVSKWTGIPVTKMLEGDMEKLVKMEDRLHNRVISQDEAMRPLQTQYGGQGLGFRTPTGR